MTLADRILDFYSNLHFSGTLPDGINIMNPFREPAVMGIADQFYHKHYNDNDTRTLILGINPGRFGGGVTGIPFTDSKRLKSVCGIDFPGRVTHEPSSVFVYDVVNAFGGPEAFYRTYYINSICPLGFTRTNGPGKEVNYNYYDSRELTVAVYGFILWNIQAQINLGCRKDVCILFGTGKNEQFMQQLNERYHFFDQIIALPHPRYIMQYKAKEKEAYIAKYLHTLKP